MLRDKVCTITYAYRWMFCPNTCQHWCSIWSDKQHIRWDIVLCPTVVFHTVFFCLLYHDTFLALKVTEAAGLTSGFSGCISDLKINTIVYNLTFNGRQLPNGLTGRAVTNCMDHPCDSLMCQNGGTCTNMNNLDSYCCVCPDGYIDKFCQTQTTNPCVDEINGGCHTSSTCLFDPQMRTPQCRCPFTPDHRTGEFCNQSMMTCCFCNAVCI